MNASKGETSWHHTTGSPSSQPSLGQASRGMLRHPWPQDDGKCHRIFLPEVDSTNREMRRRMPEIQHTGGFWIVEAGVQTDGYGTKGSRWISASPHNFYGSYCFVCPADIAPGLLVLGVAYGIYTQLRPHVHAQWGELMLKWPNDVCLRKDTGLYKVGGVLIERTADRVICGVGINAAEAPVLEPDENGSAAAHLGLHRDLVSHAASDAVYGVATLVADAEQMMWDMVTSESVKCVERHMRELSAIFRWHLRLGQETIPVTVIGIDEHTGFLQVLVRDNERRDVSHGNIYAVPLT